MTYWLSLVALSLAYGPFAFGDVLPRAPTLDELMHPNVTTPPTSTPHREPTPLFSDWEEVPS